MVELEVRSQTLLKPLPGGEWLLLDTAMEPKPGGGGTSVGVWGLFWGCHSLPLRALPCPTGDSPAPPIPKRVGLLHVSRVISEVFGDRLAPGGRGTPDSFPLQQKVLLCSLLLLTRHLRAQEVTLGKVSGGGGTLPGLDAGSGFVSLGSLLDAAGHG